MATPTHSNLNSTVPENTHLSSVNGNNTTKDRTRTNSLSRRKFLVTAGTGGTAISLFGGYASWGGLLSDSDANCREGAVVTSPLRGEWMVMNPPGHPALADDFIGMKEGRRLPYPATSVPHHLVTQIEASRAYGWGRPVYAPVAGTVIEVSNDEPDKVRLNLGSDAAGALVSPPAIEDGDIRPAAGNYVTISSDEGISFLAHLRKGSITVAEGMHVTSGEFLGEVGNSGASLFPHLHYQLMSEWTTDVSRIEDVLLPYQFAGYEKKVGNLIQGHSWETVKNCVPAQRERFRIPTR